MSARGILDEVELVLVDGNNLLHRTERRVDDAGVRTLIARMRLAIRPPVETVLVLDGHSAPGTPSRQRISGSLELRHAGSVKADDAIVQLLTARPYAARARTLVVTDDRALTERARHAGGRTARLEWLTSLLDRPAPGAKAGTPIGRGRRPPRGAAAGRDDAVERDPWQPGRGATAKRGNPRRTPRRGRSDTGTR